LKFFSASSLDTFVEDVLPEAYQKAKSRLIEVSDSSEEIDLQAFFLDLTTRVIGLMAYDASQ
jgi:hypothetical protein